MEFFERLRRRKVGFGQTWLLLERAIRSPLLYLWVGSLELLLWAKLELFLVSLVFLYFLNKISWMKNILHGML
jgi:hypothetical protein